MARKVKTMSRERQIALTKAAHDVIDSTDNIEPLSDAQIDARINALQWLIAYAYQPDHVAWRKAREARKAAPKDDNAFVADVMSSKPRVSHMTLPDGTVLTLHTRRMG